jgi:lysozyme
MLNMQLGPQGTRLIKSFEKCTLFVYDDAREPPVEWGGGHVDGTLTVGWGHTDDARGRLPTPDGKIVQGLRITQVQADAIFLEDMAECVEDCNRSFDTPPTQGEFDAATSFRFNCGIANLRKLLAPYNDGDPAGTAAKFPLYKLSKGKLMAGLVRRRAAEQALWNGNEPLAPVPAPHAGMTPDTPTHTVPPSHLNSTAVAAGAGAAMTAAQQAQDQLANLNVQLTTLNGISAAVTGLLANPKFLVAAIVCGLVFALWYAHRQHTPT